MEAKTGYDVILNYPGDNLTAVIIAIKANTGLSLSEAKSLVDATRAGLVIIKEGISKYEAETIKDDLLFAGAKVYVV
ncbi:ribosomal protein L7/L12 [Spirosoma litoris]